MVLCLGFAIISSFSMPLLPGEACPSSGEIRPHANDAFSKQKSLSSRDFGPSSCTLRACSSTVSLIWGVVHGGILLFGVSEEGYKVM